jgi:hypothetical protein
MTWILLCASSIGPIFVHPLSLYLWVEVIIHKVRTMPTSRLLHGLACLRPSRVPLSVDIHVVLFSESVVSLLSLFVESFTILRWHTVGPISGNGCDFIFR